MAHGNIAVVAAEEHLIALRYDVPVLADAGVHRRLASAGADGLYLGYRVRQLQKPLRAGEAAGQEVRPQAEAQHGDVLVIDDTAELVYLLRSEELCLIRDDDVVFPGGVILIRNVLLRCDYLRAALKAYAAADNIRAVARVDAGLDEPDRHAQLLVIKLRYQRLRGLRRAHRAVFEI